MRKRTVVIPIVVAAVVVAAVLATAAWRYFGAGTAIETQAPGVWQEQTSADPVRLTVSAADGAGDAAGGPEGTAGAAPAFWVTLPDADVLLPAHLDGDQILVQGEGAQDVLWVITYDEGADALLLTRPDGSERHILRRVSE